MPPPPLLGSGRRHLTVNVEVPLDRDLEVDWYGVPLDRDLEVDWYGVPPTARRHLAKPLVRGGFDAPTHPER